MKYGRYTIITIIIIIFNRLVINFLIYGLNIYFSLFRFIVIQILSNFCQSNFAFLTIDYFILNSFYSTNV